MNHTVLHEEDDNRGGFYLERDGVRVAEMTYRRDDARSITIVHTFVDPALRGRGVARTLLDAAVAWARQTGMKITPRCSYVIAQFAHDKSIADLRA